MSFSVEFGHFSKRINSTKRPGGMTSIDVVLKDGCSKSNPVFLISKSSFDYNYAKWGDHYYWITDVEYTRNHLFTVSCRVDSLATYRDEIKNTSAFVLYASGANNEIPDGRLSQNTTATVVTNTAAFSSLFNAAGCFLLSAVGSDDGSGGVNVYKLTFQQLSTLLNHVREWADQIIITDYGAADITTAIKNLMKTISASCKIVAGAGSAMDNIRSCIWVPWDVPTTEAEEIYLGMFPTGVSAGVVSTAISIGNVSIGIPWQFSDWRNSASYTDIYLYIPFIGNIAINASEVRGETTIVLNVSLSNKTGDIAVEVRAGNQVIGTYGAYTAAQVPVGVSNITPGQIFNMVAGVATSLYTGVPTGMLTGISAGVVPHQTTVGGTGSSAGAGIETVVRCTTVCHSTNVEPSSVSSVIGVPKMAAMSLSGLSGYVQTRDFSLSANAHDDELNEVNRLMDGGVYLE